MENCFGTRQKEVKRFREVQDMCKDFSEHFCKKKIKEKIIVRHLNIGTQSCDSSTATAYSATGDNIGEHSSEMFFIHELQL